MRKAWAANAVMFAAMLFAIDYTARDVAWPYWVFLGALNLIAIVGMAAVLKAAWQES